MIVRIALSAALALLAAPGATGAQPAGQVSRVGFLGARSSASANVEAFRQGLRELGWAEGQNIVIEYRFAEGRFDRLPDLAADLVRLKVDVMTAAPTPGAVAAKKATGTIPIVMVGVGDPVGLGLIASLARPGGNVTGLSFDAGMEIGKGLEILKETLPKVRRVAVLSNPANPSQPTAMKNVKAAARSLGVELRFLEARGPDEFDGAFATMAKERVGALLVVTDSTFYIQRARLADLAAKNRLPAVCGFRDYVEAGALMSYGPSVVAMYQRAAFFVDRILKGAQSASLPVEPPTKFELVINLKTTRALGLSIPQPLLLRTDHLIE
jgi:putative ABC transport system substrate-binding protein